MVNIKNGWVIPAALMLSAGGVSAQKTLEQRVEALEAQTSSALSFGSKIELYGFVKADLIYDLDADLGNTFFGLADLGGAIAPTGDETFTAQSFISRFGFNYRDPTAAGDLRINIEADFLGNGDRDFQLRHAYGELGNLLVGETWTNSMSIENYPGSVDFQGPAGILFARPTQIRYSADLADGLVGSVSVESAAFASDDPVLTAALSYTGDNYFIKASVLGGRLNTDIGTTEDAYGVQLSGSGQLWDGGSVQLALAQGEGISSYFAFAGADSYLGEAVEATGVTLGITQALTDQFSVGLTAGYRENDIGALDDTETLQTLHLAAYYNPLDNVTYGVEYITGERETFGNESFTADRVQFSAQYRF